eukprot:1119998-Amphidinium_carterae.1
MALGWEVISACEVKDHFGVLYDMRKRSPAFMKSLAKEASRSCIDASYRARRKLHGRSSWWSPIDAARRKMKGNREKAAVFANLGSGCCWTASTLYKRGLSPTARCALCGADGGTYAHRLLHCSRMARYRQNLKDKTMGYLLQLSKDDAPVRCVGPPGKLNGRIYTDGSSIAPLDLQSRRAGWAVVSLDSDDEVCQINYGAVPLSASTLQTARDAEDMAFAVVLGQVDGTRVQDVHVDCQGTIARATGRRHGYALAKDTRAHMWINQDLAVHLSVHKVKAHQRFSVHMTNEQRRDAKGNAIADAYAKKGALEH